MPNDYPRWLYANKDKEKKEKENKKENKKEKKEKDQKESKTVKETEKEKKTPVNKDEFMYTHINSRNDKLQLFIPSQHWEIAKKMTKL